MHDEDVQIGGLREIKEELGLSFQTTDLAYKGIFKIDYEISNLTDREFCHMYFHNVINPLPFAPGEEVDDDENTCNFFSTAIKKRDSIFYSYFCFEQ